MKNPGRLCKQRMTREMAERFGKYPDFFLTSFSNIGVGKIEELRKGFKKEAAAYMVVKNSLLKRAIKEAGRGVDLGEVMLNLGGSCGIMFSGAEPALVARKLVDFGKNDGNFKVLFGFIGGQPISGATVAQLAYLPSRDVLLSMLAASAQAPISGFVSMLGNLVQNLVGTLDAIKGKKS